MQRTSNLAYLLAGCIVGFVIMDCFIAALQQSYLYGLHVGKASVEFPTSHEETIEHTDTDVKKPQSIN